VWNSSIAIFMGAGFGSLVRWCLGLWLNPRFATIPLGTLAANVIGGLLMGLLMGTFLRYGSFPPLLRLALTTGFLGGLTTFSSFSAETSTLLLRGQFGWAATIVGLHVGASVMATLAGIAAIGWMATRASGAV